MKKIGVIHTTPVTIQSTAALIRNNIKEVQVMNILDDSMLSDMAAGANVEFVKERWIEYAKVLEKEGADVVLSACSTVGPFAEAADKMLDIPVLRIDEAMAEEAVRCGKHISVLATFWPTLEPTTELIQRKDPDAEVKTSLIEGAYDALAAGDKKIHNELIVARVREELAQADVIVLAQASMAAALADCDDLDKSKILTSPVSGIMRLKETVEKIA